MDERGLISHFCRGVPASIGSSNFTLDLGLVHRKVRNTEDFLTMKLLPPPYQFLNMSLHSCTSAYVQLEIIQTAVQRKLQ